MLKNCFLPTQYTILPSQTCGEIICQSETSFTIICKFCKLRIFQFNEFLQHFRNAHWPEINVVDISYNTSDVNDQKCSIETAIENEVVIKTELHEEQNILYEYLENADEDYDANDPEEWRQEKETHQSVTNNIEEDVSSDMQETIGIFKKKLKTTKQKQRHFKCSLCTCSFGNKAHYEAHVLKHQSFQFKCEKCCKSFAKEIQLTQHQHSHNGYSCQICSKVFKKYDSLRFHKETHIQTKDFVCDYNNCTKAFVNLRRLKVHKRLHFLEATFVCDVCGSRQRNKKALTDHIRTHTGEKPFACALCDRRFTSKSLLGEHKACHATERKHVCDVCGKSFNLPKALYHHKHLHMDVKKFVCKMCGVAFAQAAGLSAHMRKHKNNKVITNTPTNSMSNDIISLPYS